VTEREKLLVAVELLPEGTKLELLREDLLKALRGAEPSPPDSEPSPNGDRWLSAQEAAEKLGYKRGWIYTHADELPFVNKVNGKFRCSENALDKYMSMRR
jgi:hypothetical protein